MQTEKNRLEKLGADEIELADIGKFVYSPIPQDEKWKISLIKECLEMRSGSLESNLSRKEVTHILNTVLV